jgi:hypothetical protein
MAKSFLPRCEGRIAGLGDRIRRLKQRDPAGSFSAAERLPVEPLAPSEAHTALMATGNKMVRKRRTDALPHGVVGSTAVIRPRLAIP